MYNEHFFIPTYVINLKKRTERLSSIREQFRDKKEFDVIIVEACEHPIGNVGLWNSIRNVIQLAIQNDDDIIIICEDDHYFTPDYKEDYLIANIIGAAEHGCEVLSGGVGGFGKATLVSANRFTVDWFWCTQFIVVYRNFFDTILNAPFTDTDTVDGMISELGKVKMLLFPFISIQSDFGYSDVTNNNDLVRGLINTHFKDAGNELEELRKPLYSKGNYVHDRETHRSKDADEIVPFINDLLQPASVVDFGCGLGHFLSAFKELGVREILGLDGNWNASGDLTIDHNEFLVKDFENPVILHRMYDLAICLEVAEHIKEEASDMLVDSLVNASDRILFSAAIPGQGGQNHINEQWVDYWIEKFEARGFTFYDPIRKHFWKNNNIHWWYRQNTFLVIKNTVIHNFSAEPILTWIHPDHYKQKIR